MSKVKFGQIILISGGFLIKQYVFFDFLRFSGGLKV